MDTTGVFVKTCEAWNAHPRYISSCGGTRSGKTFSILQWLYLVASQKTFSPPRIFSIVSESIPHLKRGAIRDFKSILVGSDTWRQDAWSETGKTYTFPNGNIIEFFSVDNAGKVYGSARDYLFINEAQHIDYEIARQLFVRTRNRIVLDYNPTHSFWANEQIESRENCIRIHSTYKDNQYLTEEQVKEIESNKGDRNWWQVFGEGKVGTLEGLIYSFDLCDALPARDEFSHLVEVQGLDFGFAADPTARVQCLADKGRKEVWVRERCYRTHMLNGDIIADLQQDGIGRGTPIYADCAEPKSIEEIRRAGFKVIPCDKNAPVRSDRLKFQLQWMQGWKLHVTKDSLNLINELRNYTWEKDSSGNALNYPIDKFNHACDAMRYALYTHFANGNSGNYNISIL